MKPIHKIKYVLWSFVVSIVMTNDRMRFEYNDDKDEALKRGRFIGSNEWLHRRWFPNKYDYEQKAGG